MKAYIQALWMVGGKELAKENLFSQVIKRKTIFMTESGRMISFQEKELITGLTMDQHILEIGWMEISMEMGKWNNQVNLHIKGNGKMINIMDLQFKHLMMELHTLANTKITICTDMAIINGQKMVVDHTMAKLKKVKCMVLLQKYQNNMG